MRSHRSRTPRKRRPPAGERRAERQRVPTDPLVGRLRGPALSARWSGWVVVVSLSRCPYLRALISASSEIPLQNPQPFSLIFRQNSLLLMTAVFSRLFADLRAKVLGQYRTPLFSFRVSRYPAQTSLQAGIRFPHIGGKLSDSSFPPSHTVDIGNEACRSLAVNAHLYNIIPSGRIFISRGECRFLRRRV